MSHWQITNRYPLVFVEWTDPSSVDHWEDIHNIDKRLNKIYTAGWVVNETDKIIIIIMSLNVDDEERKVSCTMIIHKALITKRFEVIAAHPPKFTKA